ncbi:phosphate/phosphite/phosphonate ABC transporter substrate-binding protein [Alsobacter sp. SYSU BS001988]
MSLVANARMYAVNAAVAEAWAALFGRVAAMSGVALEPIPHAAPAPLEELWRRPDLGLAFICGYPFATGGFGLEPVAAPIPASGDGRPHYATRLVARADGPIRTLEDSFGGRIGWTAEHSQSGFQALRTHLLPYAAGGRRLYAQSVGRLQTPRRVIDAVLSGAIDIGPLDSFFHDLLLAHEPDTAAGLRIVATTAARPMPLLAASPAVGAATLAGLRAALLGLSRDDAGRATLARLRLSGFAAVDAADYAVLRDEAEAADKAGYRQPG